MVAGDFVEVYGQPGYRSKFDAVATCFFLDTAHNIFEYIDVIWNTLKVGGGGGGGGGLDAKAQGAADALSSGFCGMRPWQPGLCRAIRLSLPPQPAL